MSNLVKLVVTVPDKDADMLREAIGKADGGKVGNYTHCSFSVKGTGRFRPEDSAQPAIGVVGKFEEVAEQRIEVTCSQNSLKQVVQAIRKAHPYEEPAIDIFPMLEEPK